MNEIIKLATPIAAAVSVVLFALPSYVGTLRLKGLGKGLLVLVSLGVFALIIETIAVKTGVLYGKFTYGDALGYKLFGAVPWPVAFAYPPIVLGAFWLARKITDTKWVVLLAALFALVVDIALGPALTRMELWQWETSGPYYGIPIIGFIGRFVSYLLATSLLVYVWGDTAVRRTLAWSVFAMLWFWSGVNLGLQQWIPGAIGISVGALLLIIMWAEKRREQHKKLA